MRKNKVAKTAFLGVVVAAASRNEAERMFAESISGNSAVGMADEDKSFQFITHAECSASAMNPKTGELDLSEATGLVGDLEFVSGDQDINAHYTVCVDGCGSHIISESGTAVTHCLDCGTAIKQLSEEEINEALASTNDIDASGIVAVASTKEEAASKYAILAFGREEAVCLSDSDGNQFITSESSGEFKYNPFTGAADVEKTDGIKTEVLISESSSDDLEANYYVCSDPECGSHLVSTSSDTVICPSCSAGLLEPEISESSVELDLDQDEEESNDDESVLGEYASESSDEDHDYEDDMDDEEDMDSDEDSDDDDSDEDDSEEDDEDDSDDDDDSEDDSDEDEDDDSDEEADRTLSLSTVDIDGLALAAKLGEVTAEELSVVHLGDVNSVSTWAAIANSTVIATANPVTAAKHLEMFSSKSFGQKVKAIAEDSGVVVALKDMGFEMVAHKLDVPTFVQEQIESQSSAELAEVQGELQAQVDTLSDRYAAALSTSFVGIDKGMWKDLANPIQSSLIEALSSAGIKDADVLVNKVIADNSEKYLQMAVAKAQDLMEFTAEAQNQVATMVEEANYAGLTSPSTEDRLASLGRALPQEEPNHVDENIESVSAQNDDFSGRVNQALNF